MHSSVPRSLLAFLASALAVRAQTTITFTNGQTSNTALSTSAPNSPTTLALASGAATQSGVISGSGALAKTGSGTLTLSAANTYTGNTTVSAGTLALQSTYQSPAFAISSGATLELNTTTIETDYAATTFSGTGTLRKTGSGIAYWGSGATTFALGSGARIDVQAGTLTGGSFGNEVWTNNKSDLNVAAGAVFSGVEANVRVDALTGSGTIRSGYNGSGAVFTFGVDNGSGTFSGTLANTDATHLGSFAKEGTGTQRLVGTSTYSGTTTISAGTLQFAKQTALYNNTPANWTASNLKVASGATAAFNVGGSGEFTAADLATLAALGTATGGFASGSILALDTTNASSGTVTIATNLANANTVTLAKQGLGTLVLSGNNTFTGGLLLGRNVGYDDSFAQISGTPSRLSLASAGALGSTGPIEFRGTALQFTAANTTDYSSRFSTASNQAFNFDTNGQNVSFATALAAPDSILIKGGAGTLTLGGSNVAQQLLLFGGTLRLASGASLGSNSYLELVDGTLQIPNGTLTSSSTFVGSDGKMISILSGYDPTLDAYIGTTSGRAASVTFDAGTWNPGSLAIGVAGSSTPNGPSTGTVTINGGNVTASSITLGGHSSAAAGSTHTGTLNVTAGSVSATSATLGYRGIGTANISGGNFTTSNLLSIGSAAGVGTFNVSGGIVSTSSARLGYDGTAAATLSGGTWNNTNTLLLGLDQSGVTSPYGSTLNITGGILNTASLTAWRAPQNGSGHATINISSGALHVTNAILLNGNTTVTLSGGMLTSGSGTIGYSVDGAVVNVAGGTWNNSGAIGVSYETSGAGTLNLTSGNLITATLNVGRLGTLNVSGGNLTSSGSLGLRDVGGGVGATTNMTGGTLSVAGVTIERDAALHLSGGTLNSSANIAVTGSGSVLRLAGSGVANLASGTGTLTLASGASLQLGGAAGQSAVAAGTLNATAVSNSLGAASVNFNQTGAYTFAPALTGNLTITKSGSGTTTLTGTNTYTGTTTINAGTLQFAKLAALYNATPANWTAANLTVASGATAAFNVGGTGEFTASDVATLAALGSASGGFLSGSSLGLDTTNAAGGAFTYDRNLTNPNGGANALGLAKLGTGTLTLSGTNTYTGATTISAGTLTLGAANAVPTSSAVIVNSGATFNLGGFSATTGSIAGAGNIALGSGRLTTGGNGDSTSFGGVMSGSGGLTKSGNGTLTLSGASTYTGGTTISGGTLLLSGSLPSLVQVAGGATLQLAAGGLVTGVAGVNGVNGGLGDTRNGANGSAAISIDAGAFLVNQGSVTGGSGGNGGQGGTTFFKTRGGDGGFAGAGAVLGGGAQGNNSGTITGGRGGDGGAPGSSYGTPRSGGIGVDAGASSTFTNSGTIIGGAGGNASSTSAGNGGVGLVLAAGSSLDNTGTIAGGAAGMSSSGAAGGIALVAENATIVNSGTLRGGTNSVGARAAAVILNGTANTLELRAGFNLQGSVIGNAASDTLLLGGAADATLQASGGTAAFSGIETLRKNGASTWTLLGDFTGATTIDEGTLLVGNGTTHGALFGAITNNGTLIFNSNSATTRADTLAGSGSIEKQGTGTLTFQTANTHTGTTTISAGTVVLANGGALGATTAGTSVKNGATLTLQNVAVGAEPLALNGTGVGSAGALTATGTASLAGTVMLESDTRIGVATPGHVLTLSGAISGNAALEKTGSGTLVLGGANTYTGSTTIAAGTLRFASPSAFYNNTSANWTAANIVVSSGATAVFNVGGVGEFTAANIDTLKALGTASGGFKNGAFIGFDTTNASGGVFTYNGSISNPNGGANTLGLVKLGSGTLLLSGSNTYSGDTFVHAGTLRLGAAGASSPNSALYVAPGAVFDANGFQPTFNMVTGSGQIDVGSAGFILAPPLGVQTLSVQLSGSGGLTLNGGGTVELGTANNFQGAATLTAGTLKLGVTGALPTNVPVEIASGATLDLNSHAATLGRFAGAGNVALGSATLTIAQGDHTTFTGTISGSGGLAKSGAGRLTLTGTNTYSGATAITGGEIKLNGSAASSAFTLAGGGMLSGNGTVGALTIGSGGILSPGNSPGTTSAGNTTFAGGGSFLWELNSTGGAAGSNPGWDLLSISGSLTLNATPANKFTINLTSLTLANAAGSVSDFSSASNYSFAFVTATGGITGFDASAFTLDTTNFQNAFTGTWSIGQSGNALTLNYTASAIPEPSTYAGIAGAAMLGVALWCRRKKS